MSPARPDPLLEIRGARLVRGEAEVLHGITMTIHRGEHTAIVGPNGAGKSSLLRLLTRDSYALVDTEADAPVRIFGQDRWDVFELRTRLGIVTADLHEQFVRDAWLARAAAARVVLSGLLSAYGVFDHHEVTPAMRGDAAAALARMGVADLSGRAFNTLSTGEARRVLIARALVSRPEMLILDEPTTGLDVVARHRFLETIRAIAREGTTLVVVTQHLEEIVPEIERAVLLNRGQIAADGPKSDVLTASRLGDLFGAPVEVSVSNGYYGVRPLAPL